MRVMVIFAHPVETSFGAALHGAVLESLRSAGHEVDDCDLYAENFQPVLTREERLGYHTVPDNRSPVQSYVDRLMQAQALVLVHPVWNYGPPAILKGFYDRVFLPGVSFQLTEEGLLRPNLQHIRKLAVVTTYGGTWLRTFLVGDPPRRFATRVLRYLIKPAARVHYMALYDMNRADTARREAFLARVKRTLAGF